MQISSFMESIINEYYCNNAKKIRSIVDMVVSRKFGGTADKNMSDYYSIADDVMIEIIRANKYDSMRGDFDKYFYTTLIYAFIDCQKHDSRQKRSNTKYVLDSKGNKVLDENGKPQKVVIADVSLNEQVSNGESNLTYGDIVSARRNVEDDVFESLQSEETYSEKMCEYLKRLSDLQKKVLYHIANGYTKKEILQKLHITENIYLDCCEAIHSFKNVSVLINKGKKKEETSSNK